jgi:hypothetical protein
VTALLAAVFVLIAMRQGSGLKHDRIVPALIYVWLFQNLVLVISSIWRTQLYIADYSLTYLRLAALLWMGLVLTGLVLIVIKIVRDLSSAWLVKANVFATLALLLAICPLDLGRFIAGYNLAHSSEMGGGGSYSMDISYLRRIGVSALPALWALERKWHAYHTVPMAATSELCKQLEQETDDWRRWTFRAYRLAREVNCAEGATATTRAAPPP